MIRRREFITLLGGATAAWPLTARAQGQKCVGMLMYGSSNESDGQSFVATFVQGMRKIGWVDGQK
jgi:putative tryptophan/tyrosine transport system substrate-binding protein